jgi:poly-gamma-glutamate synthesis protein (capsule biosynthesis protein)
MVEWKDGRHRFHPSILPLFLLLSFLVISCVPARQAAPDLAAYPWLYLRGGEPPAAGEAVVEVVAAGDVMLGRGVAQDKEPLAEVAPWLRAADVAIANLECVLAPTTAPRPGPYRLQAPASAARALRRAGLGVLGLANNHALDYGAAGLAGTVEHLAAAGLVAAGAGVDAAAASQPQMVEAGGLRLAILAFSAVSDPEDDPDATGWTPARWDEERATAAVTSARGQADAVIVLMHWGYEYELRADPAQRTAARALVEAGADLVIGHHPHVVQGTELYGALVSPKRCCGWSPDEPLTHTRYGLIAYSLGNLVFDQEQGDTRYGLALRAFFDADGLRAVQSLPLWAGPRPRLMAAGEAAALLARVQPPAQRLGFACARSSPAGSPAGPAELSCLPVDAQATEEPDRSGPFRAGEIDLTGDGVPEQVQLVDGQVVVYENGAEAWRGQPEWTVLDLALGDPNDDGRGEIVLALDKADGSHPFVVGYRGGIYRVLWGGSAVARAMREVELGDVDGDGVQELVVLEDAPKAAGQSAVTVWRWHGWGFTQLWRSAPGRYSHLSIDPAAISVQVQP